MESYPLTKPFNLEEILEMEKGIIEQLPVDIILPDLYFKSEVANFLYNKWLEDKNDNRLMLYCLPLVHANLIKKRAMLKYCDLNYIEIFNHCCIKMFEAMEKYDSSKGTIYNYINKMMWFKAGDLVNKKPKWSGHEVAVDELAEFMGPYDDTSNHILNDFKCFLSNLKEYQGLTTCKILDTFLDILNKQPEKTSQGQNVIIEEICRATKLPIEIITPTYMRIIDRYTHSVID